MKVQVERLGNTSFTIMVRGHLALSDQPVSGGGTDVGMTPPEFFLASLGACVASHVGRFCDARAMECERLEVQVQGKMAKAPDRIGSISVDVRLPGELEAELRRALQRAAQDSVIHNTLTHAPEIRVRIQATELARS